MLLEWKDPQMTHNSMTNHDTKNNSSAPNSMAATSIATCIRNCWECRATCQSTLFNHCLEMGGAHVEKEHVKLMLDCIQACQTCADFMTRNSLLHPKMCAVYAEVCEACAISCEAIDSPEMQACAAACRKCAITCREMGDMKAAV